MDLLLGRLDPLLRRARRSAPARPADGTEQRAVARCPTCATPLHPEDDAVCLDCREARFA